MDAFINECYATVCPIVLYIHLLKNYWQKSIISLINIHASLHQSNISPQFNPKIKIFNSRQYHHLYVRLWRHSLVCSLVLSIWYTCPWPISTSQYDELDSSIYFNSGSWIGDVNNAKQWSLSMFHIFFHLYLTDSYLFSTEHCVIKWSQLLADHQWI